MKIQLNETETKFFVNFEENTSLVMQKATDIFFFLVTRAKRACYWYQLQLKIDRRHTISVTRLSLALVCAIALSVSTRGYAESVHTSTVADVTVQTAFQMTSKPEWKAASENPVQTVDLDRLSGRKLASLNAAYIGIRGATPKTAEINFSANLEKMWQRKLQFENVSDATIANTDMILERYSVANKTRQTLPTFVTAVEAQIELGRRSIDWTGYCNNRKLSAHKCEVLQKVAAAITGEHLVAYAMTELFPNREDGRWNAALLDTLLQNAGREYIDAIPAGGDRLASLGAWQFTSYAVRKDDTNTEGASIVNEYVAESYKIPGSVVKLVGHDHERAAYMFAVFNITNLLKKGSDVQASNLLALVAAGRMDEVAQFLAAAHHQPAYAVTKTSNWLAAGTKGNLAPYLTSRLQIYAGKAKANIAGLREYLREYLKVNS
jgi:hypothetical protein